MSTSQKSLYGQGIKPVEINPRVLLEALLIDADDASQHTAKTLAHILTVLESILREKDDRIDEIITKYGAVNLEKITPAEETFSRDLFVLKRDVNQCVQNLSNDLLLNKIRELSMKKTLDAYVCLLLELTDRANKLKLSKAD